MTKKFCDRCGKPAVEQSSIMSLQPIGKDVPERLEVRVLFYKDKSGRYGGEKADVDLCVGCRAHYINEVMVKVVRPQLRAEGLSEQPFNSEAVGQ